MYEYEYERWRGARLRRQAAGQCLSRQVRGAQSAGETRSRLALELAAVITVIGLGAVLRVLGLGLA
jgi:hypothetical protein